MAALMSVFARFRPDTTGFKREAETQLRAMNLDAVSGALGKRAGTVAAKAFGGQLGEGIGDGLAEGFDKDRKSGPAAKRSGARTAVSFAEGLTTRLNTSLKRLNLPEVDLKADPAEALAAVALTKERLEALSRDGATVEIRVNATKALADVTRFTKQLEGAVVPSANRAGQNASAAFGEGFADRGGTFARVIATMAAKATIFGAATAGATVPVLNLTAALLPATGALLAVPAALAGASAAAFTFQAATEGVGKAIEKGLGPGGEAYEKALDLLTPAQRAFTEEVVGLGDALDEMNDRAAQPFFAKLIGQVQPLADLYIPVLGDKMSKLAPEISQVGLEFANVARQGATVNTVSAVFDKTTGSVKALASTTGPLTVALRDVLDATLTRAPAVSQGFQRMALNFAAYVSEAAKSGRVNELLDQGIATLKQLGTIAGDVGAIFGAVFRAATTESGSLLDNLEKITGKAAEFFETRESAAALTATFATLSALGDALKDSLGAVLPAIGQSLESMSPTLQQLAPIAADLVRALAPLLPYFTQLTVVVLQALIPGLAALVGWLSRNSEVAKVIATVLGGLVLSMKLHAAATAISAGATRGWAAATAVAAAINKVWNSTFVTRLRLWAIDTVAQLKNVAATSASAVALGAQKVAMVATTIATRIATISTAAFGAALTFATGPIGLIIIGIGLLVAGIIYLYKNNETARKIIDAVWAGIKTAVKATADFVVNTVWPALQRAWQGIASGAMWLYNNAIKPAWSGIQAYIGFVINVIKTYINIGIAVFRGIATVVTWLYSNIFQPVFNAIAKVVQIWWFAVRIVFQAFVNIGTRAISSAISGLRTFFGVIFTAIGKLVSDWWTGVKIIFGAFMRYVVGPVVGAARALWSFLTSIFNGIARVVAGWWAKIRGYFDQLRAFWTAVFFVALNMLRDKIATIVEAIRARVAGWMEKLRGYFDIVRRLWTGVATAFTEVYNTKIKPLFDKFIGFITKNVVGGFKTGVDAIRTAWSKVQEAARKPVEFVVNKVINPFIGGLNKAAEFVGIKDRLPPIAGFESGGRIPGPDFLGGDNMLASIKGTRKQIAVATGEFINNVRSTQANRGLLETINRKRGKVTREDVDPHLDGYADGGLIGGFFKKVVNGAKGIGNFIADPGAGLRKVAESVLAQLPGANSGIGRMVAGAAMKSIKGIGNWLKDKIGFGGVGGDGASFGKWPSSPAAQRGDSGVWRRVVALIKSGPKEGSFGNAYRPGDPKWHGSGRAVDWMGFNMDRLARFLVARKPLEFIHRTNQRDYAYTRGKNKGSFNNSLMQAHRNHIHVAFRLGGLVDKLAGMLAGFRNGGPVKLMDKGGRWPTGTVRANQSGYDEHVMTGGPSGDMAQMLATLAAILAALERLTESIGPDVAEALRDNTRRAVRLGRGMPSTEYGQVG